MYDSTTFEVAGAIPEYAQADEGAYADVPPAPASMIMYDNSSDSNNGFGGGAVEDDSAYMSVTPAAGSVGEGAATDAFDANTGYFNVAPGAIDIGVESDVEL